MSEEKKIETKFGIPVGTGKGGLLMPVMAYRFRAIIEPKADPVWDDDAHREVTQQVVACRFDYKRKWVELVVRQPVVGRMQTMALRMAQDGLRGLRVDALDGGNEAAYHSVLASTLTCLEHETKYDYSVSEPLTHRFLFEADRLWVELPNESATA